MIARDAATEDWSRSASATLRHRGPDSVGQWYSPQGGLVLGHRRLAIVDLSTAGSQPMVSPTKRWVVTFNGEIYNHLELRQEIEKAATWPSWRGHSDTETLVAAIELFGVEAATARLSGMFAFAAWDSVRHELWLARDRVGEKPLYLVKTPRGVAFASEVAALMGFPGFNATIDRDSLELYVRFNCVPGNRAIFEAVTKVAPGTLMHLRECGAAIKEYVYWSARDVARSGLSAPFMGSDAEAVERLKGLLHHSVRSQLMSDVPLGVLLSGGVDSTTIAAIMAMESSKPVNSFTVGFGEAEFDESVHAKAIANHLGTTHQTVHVSTEEAREVIPRLPSIYSEPFADSSQIPTAIVMQMARRNVKVCLAGDGGDEIFGGYTRYALCPRISSYIHRMPKGMRHAFAKALLRTPTWVLSRVGGVVGLRSRFAHFPQKVRKLASRLSRAEDLDALYCEMLVEWGEVDRLVVGSKVAWDDPVRRNLDRSIADPLRRMMLADISGYLPDDILTKVDRASMAVSLELRVPFLDPRVIEFAWSLPSGMLLRKGEGKWVLKELLRGYVPAHLTNRPKQGFAIPLDDWLRGPLRDWADDLLSPSRLRAQGLFDAQIISRAWAAHRRGEALHGYRLWSILMFQGWLSSIAPYGAVSPSVETVPVS